MKYILYFLICFTLFSAESLKAQIDPHFTQNYTYPMYINPAMAGGSDGEYRVSAVYRGQWGSITNPYTTTGVSFDTRTNKNIALGAQLLNQSAGDGGYNYFNASASFVYTGVKFGNGDNHRMLFAMQFGLINRHLNRSKLKWGEQWNPITGYNANNPVTESLNTTSATTMDIGAGMLYYNADVNKESNVFAGFSAYHLNKPRDPIISEQNSELNTTPVRYMIHGGISINLSKQIRVIPHTLFMQQGSARELMIGAYTQLNVNSETDLMVGAYYRLNDAVAPYVGFEWKNFAVGLSYDANASKLGLMTRNVNSFEISFSYIRRSASKTYFDYIHCPRL